ncbi:MAG: ABC transporter substrate-binding protein [Acidimicrobiia bacterium]
MNAKGGERLRAARLAAPLIATGPQAGRIEAATQPQPERRIIAGMEKLGAGLAALVIAAACTTSAPTGSASVEIAGTTSSVLLDAAVTVAPESILSPPPSTAGELSASFRGVTPTTIEVGAVWVDYSLLRELGFSEVDLGDEDLVWQVFIDEINARGGIHGRQLRLHGARYNIISPVDAEATCIELTEDTRVFAVLHPFSTVVGSANDCVVNQHDTILVGGGASAEDMRRAAAPWVHWGTAVERWDSTLVRLAFEQGLFDGQVVAVHSLAAEVDRVPAVVEQLEQRGIEVALQSQAASEVDPTAVAAEWAILAERMRALGVTTVVIPGSAIVAYGQMIDNGLDVQVLTSDSTLRDFGELDDHVPSDYDGAIGLGGTSTPEAWADPSFMQCVHTFEEATGIELAPSPEVPPGEPVWITTVFQACVSLELFEQLAVAAGPELTNDSFREAIGAGVVSDLPASPFASLSADKYDAGDTVRLVMFDASLPPSGDVVSVTELQNISQNHLGP